LPYFAYSYHATYIFKEKTGDSKKIKKVLEKAGCATIELPSLKTPDIKKNPANQLIMQELNEV
jgi:hypothetical protein